MQLVTASFDLSRMESLLGDIHSALVGTGQDEEADARTLTKQHAKLLAWDCARAVGPRSAAGAQKSIKSDLLQVFHPMATRSGQEWKIFKGSQAGSNDTRWLYAGPTYLVGVRNEDYLPNAQDSAIEAIYNQNRENKTRSAAWQDQGKHIAFTHKYAASRGNQHVFILKRIAIKLARFNALLTKLAGRVGRMRATFAFAASELGMADIPQWISRHFAAVSADGKAIFDASALNDAKRPSIIFGSRAPGISHFVPQIQSAINSRQYKMREHLRRILNGYAKDQKAQRPIKRLAKTIPTE